MRGSVLIVEGAPCVSVDEGPDGRPAPSPESPEVVRPWDTKGRDLDHPVAWFLWSLWFGCGIGLGLPSSSDTSGLPITIMSSLADVSDCELPEYDCQLTSHLYESVPTDILE